MKKNFLIKKGDNENLFDEWMLSKFTYPTVLWCFDGWMRVIRPSGGPHPRPWHVLGLMRGWTLESTRTKRRTSTTTEAGRRHASDQICFFCIPGNLKT